MEEPVPHCFKAPAMETYDGTINPFDHLESFRFLMLLQGASDTFICMSFSTTFEEAVRAWYTQLPLELIHSFEKFGHQFMAQY